MLMSLYAKLELERGASSRLYRRVCLPVGFSITPRCAGCAGGDSAVREEGGASSASRDHVLKDHAALERARRWKLAQVRRPSFRTCPSRLRAVGLRGVGRLRLPTHPHSPV